MFRDSPWKTIHELFENKVISQPHQIALSFEGKELSYQTLNEQANQVAHHLISLGIKPGDLIAVCLERSFEQIIVILGILKAGAAYVPIEPSHSIERIKLILSNAKPCFAIVNTVTKDLLEGVRIVNLDVDNPIIKQQKNYNPEINKNAVSLAYVIFTSGTTGIPNGVCVTHSNLLKLIEATELVYDFGSDDTWTLFHSYAFDFSVWEIWGALAFGGKLIIVPYFVCRTPKDFYSLLLKERVTILNQTPSAFYQLLQCDEGQDKKLQDTLRMIIFGGEAVDIKMLKPWFEKYGDANPAIYNMYGITEVTIHATYHRFTSEDCKKNNNTIGIPLPFYQIYLLDEQGCEVQQGEKGEICIVGDCVAQGYLNNPVQTEKKFVPFNKDGNQKVLYKSGDVGYVADDGNLMYVGRLDNQIKIRGFRIELGEIEARLNQQEEIYLSFVTSKNDANNNKTICAFIQLKKDSSLTKKDIRIRLKKLLPDYMIPSKLELVTEIPLTINGKVDKQKLLQNLDPKMEKTMNSTLDEINKLIKVKLAELLEEEPELDCNFYDTGGNSMIAISFLSWIKDQFEVELSIKDLFELTIFEIIEQINNKQSQTEDALV